MEVLLNFDKTNIPYVIKIEDKYFIINNKGWDNKTEYIDDINILLNAINNAKSIGYYDMINGRSKAKSKEEFWQFSFDYMYSGNGGLILWFNPTEMWNQELARRGLLNCDNCGGKMIMYFTPQCFKCNKPTADKKGRFMLIPVCYYVSLKNSLPLREVWDSFRDTDFIFGNDTTVDLYYTGKDKIDKYIKMIDDEFPIETSLFFVSW